MINFYFMIIWLDFCVFDLKLQWVFFQIDFRNKNSIMIKCNLERLKLWDCDQSQLTSEAKLGI